MNLGTMLSNLVIGPLRLLFEVIFAITNRVLNEGASIIVLSIAVNILTLPLFLRADAIRKNRFASLHALKSALPLFLQFSLFLASHQFLSGLGCLNGSSFGPISDLSRPDQLLSLGGTRINILPILMAGSNLLAVVLYTKGEPWKSHVLPILTAVLFLVLLYNAPSGLTLFWMLSSLFSLGKSAVQNLVSGRKGSSSSRFRIPGILQGKPRPRLFFLFALLLALITGMLIPSSVIAASPLEFIERVQDLDPVWYVINASLYAVGTFILWFGVCYFLGTKPMKRGMELGAAALFGIFLVDFLFFRSGLGTMSNTLQYDVAPEFSILQKVLNLAVLIPVSAGMIWLLRKEENLVRILSLVMVFALCGLSCWNVWVIQSETNQARQVLDRNYEGAPEIPLSRDGKNVVVIMLDRAISSYLPCILQEKPELEEKFSGFIYYPNTVSFGMHTILGAPPLFGGYEYTPSAMNARDSEPLRDKHNEALLLLPTLFSGEGARVTVFDVPYPGNYTELGDYTLFDDLPNTNARIIHGLPATAGGLGSAEELRMRNFFCYSLTMSMPTVLFGTLYNMGGYNQARQTLLRPEEEADAPLVYDVQVTPSFLAEYEVLKNLGEMTRIQDGDEDTLLVMVNCMTHLPTLLREPEYVPSARIDNAAYDQAHENRFLAGPFAIQGFSDYQMAHYDVNMAALMLVGDWLENLKAEGVYDNTRIILAADHGFWLHQIKEGTLPDTGEDIMGYNPLLMVKDFNMDGPVQTNTAFMTNADVPMLALDRIIENPVNPFTGKPITGTAKTEPLQISISHEFQVGRDKGNTFPASQWYMLQPGGETLFDPSRWTLLTETE